MADFFWTMLSLALWEALTRERGWSQEQYIEAVSRTIKHSLLTDCSVHMRAQYRGTYKRMRGSRFSLRKPLMSHWS